ncbi:MAG TPA: hypothetical protein VLB76_01520 [Thermoanaerobaculia bacterium]|nr:hypothetical protein [Thermoanaerobaculia bacterium]
MFGAGGETLHYLVLGDSTAVAEGGNYEQGIAVETAGHLARGGRGVELTNVAVSGARVHDVRPSSFPVPISLMPISCSWMPEPTMSSISPAPARSRGTSSGS